MPNGKSEGAKPKKLAKVAKVDRLTTLVERYFRGEFGDTLSGKDLSKKGLLLWAIQQYAKGECGVAYVYDAVTRPGKIFYKWSSKRRMKYSDPTAEILKWGKDYYLEHNSKE